MKYYKSFFLLIGIGFILLKRKAVKKVLDQWYYLGILIPKFEGFSAVPKWDYKQWSWGYGTSVGSDHTKNPGGTITRGEALIAAMAHLHKDYVFLKARVTRDLTGKQWAVLLSFAYNVGVGSAAKLAVNINQGKDDLLEVEFKSYNKAAGQVLQSLVDRRNKEWEYWIS